MVFPKVGNGLERLLGTQEDYRAGGIVAVRGFTCHHQGRQKMSGSGRSPLFLHICTNSKGSRAFIQENKKWVDLVDLLFFFMSVPIVRGIATNKTKKILKQPVSLFFFLNLPLFLYYFQICSSLFTADEGCYGWRKVDDAATRKREAWGSSCAIMADSGTTTSLPLLVACSLRREFTMVVR